LYDKYYANYKIEKGKHYILQKNHRANNSYILVLKNFGKKS